MKLKKIASLALAGVMAVSMLTACGNTISEPENPTAPVDPVDSSFATAVNDEMSSATKNVLTFGSDATLASVLNKVAGQLDSATLSRAFTNDGFVIGDDASDFRHLMGIGRDNSLTIAIDGSGDYNYTTPFANLNNWTWKHFTTEATSANTIADLIVVPGNLTDEGVAEYVATAAKELIDADRMPNDGVNNATGDQYKYDYTGSIACVKVNNLSGDFSAYVVGVTVTQTPTRVTNVQ